MRVTQAGRNIMDARAKAEPAADVITEDFYTSLPQIALTPNPNSRQRLPDTPVEVVLDDTDVTNIAACAARHPSLNMRSALLAAIWNDPESFRRILQFGLNAPAEFPEIRKIVAEMLGRGPLVPEPGKAAAEPLLPRMPLPAHLQNRERQG